MEAVSLKSESKRSYPKSKRGFLQVFEIGASSAAMIRLSLGDELFLGLLCTDIRWRTLQLRFLRTFTFHFAFRIVVDIG